MKVRHHPWLYPLLLLSGVGYVWMNYFLVRGDFDQAGHGHLLHFLWVTTGLGMVYLLVCRFSESKLDLNLSIGMGVLFRIALIGAIPNLSDDFYRFIWDGRIWHMGMDPFAHLPSELWQESGSEFHRLMGDLYPHLNSPEYFTVYPPVLQWVFRAATWIFPGGIREPVMVMKGFVVLAELGSLLLLSNLLKVWKLPRKSILLYALNPLVILELSGNLHFEAFMILGILAMLWLLQKGKWWFASTGITLAIGAKLIPLLFFPLWFKRLGGRNWLLMGIIAGLLCLGLFWPMLYGDALANFSESITLYYQKFEFNASVYYFLTGIFGSSTTRFFGKLLPLITLGIIIYAAVKEKDKSWKGLPAMLLLGYGTYEMLATTVHPWYQAPLIAFAVLSKYRWPVLFSLLIPYTYIAYWNDYHLPVWFIWLEYLAVYAFIFYEWTFVRTGKTLEEWVLGKQFFREMIRRSIPKRMEIKLHRILARIAPEERVLDVGTGNGGLVKGLRDAGRNVTTLDVKDISFFEEVKPILYDGEKFPFEDNAFDTVIIITVLHHTPDPELILREAKRVSRKKIILMEDIYRNALQKHLTFFTDSLVNLEFAGHPHTNRDDAGWRSAFDKLGMKLTYREQFRTLIFYTQVIYELELPEIQED